MAGGAVNTNVQAIGPAPSRRVRIFAFSLVASLFFAWGFSYGLVDVLNKHFQTVFGITKLQSTLLQVAYFGAYLVWSLPAAQFMSRYGYKKGIYMGLCLYSVGAILFWPCAHYETYGGFVGATFVIGCGLATLEVAANSYVSVLGKTPKESAFLLNFAQSFNGVSAKGPCHLAFFLFLAKKSQEADLFAFVTFSQLASFVGPYIASHAFFTGANQNSLTSVQYVYLGVCGLGVLLMVLFAFCPLPEISEASLQEQLEMEGTASDAPLWKRPHCVLGFVTQFCYVGAQVTVASFALNYVTELKGLNISSAAGSRLFSYMQITFMVARFVSTLFLKFVDPALLLGIYGTACTVFCIAVAATGTRAGLICLFCVFFFESVIYPTTFTLATSNLGKYAKRGSSLVVMGVGGGAVFPPMQGALADQTSTHISYFIPMMGFLVVACYGFGYYINEQVKARSAKNSIDRTESGSGDSIEFTPDVDRKEDSASPSPMNDKKNPIAPVNALQY